MDARPAGFWSYVHADDEAEGGRITRLAGKLKEEFGLITGEGLALFVDRDIEWGDVWRDRIENALLSTTFFIPIVTPRFYASDECRKEFLRFRGHAESLGVEDLVLPILWSGVADPDEASDDEVEAAIARTQYVDWRALRLDGEDSSPHRRAVNELALRLRDVHEAVSDRPRQGVPVEGTEVETPLAEETPGILEILAEGEAALPELADAIQRFVQGINGLGVIVSEALPQIEASDNAGKGFAGRLRVARQLASALDEPATQIAAAGDDYSARLLSVDSAILTLIREVDLDALTPEEQADADEFFGNIDGLADAVSGSAGLIDEMVAALQGAARFSTDLRTPLRKIERGARGVRDGQSVMDEWVRLSTEKRAASKTRQPPSEEDPV